MISYGLQLKKMVRVNCREGGGQQNSLYYMFLFSKQSFNSINNIHECMKKNRKKSNKTNKNKIKNSCKKSTITVSKVRCRNGWL